MRWKTTLVLLVVTVGLGAYVSQVELKRPTREGREQQAKALLRLTPADVTQIAVAMPEGQFTLVRQEAGWRLQPGDYRADDGLIDSLLSATRRLDAERLLTPTAERPLDLKAYGLEPPRGTITLTLGGATKTLLLGELTAVGGNRYLKVADQPGVGIVTGRVWEETNKPAEAFRDRRLLPLASHEIEAVTVQSAPAHFHLARAGLGWRLTQPLEDQADSEEVTAWLEDLAYLRIQQFLPEAAPAPEEPASITITLQPKSEGAAPLTVRFGPALDEEGVLLHAQRSDEPYRYAVAAKDAENLLRDPHGLRSKQCFERLFPGQVEKIEVTQDGAAWMIARQDSQWVVAGTGAALETARVEAWIRKLGEARFSGFEDDQPADVARYGLAAPKALLRVWVAGQEQPQQLLIGETLKNDTSRYAKIEGRAAVVRIPEDVVRLADQPLTGLQASPATPAPAPQ